MRSTRINRGQRALALALVLKSYFLKDTKKGMLQAYPDELPPMSTTKAFFADDTSDMDKALSEANPNSTPGGGSTSSSSGHPSDDPFATLLMETELVDAVSVLVLGT